MTTTYYLCPNCGDTNDHYIGDNLYENGKRVCLTCGEPWPDKKKD